MSHETHVLQPAWFKTVHKKAVSTTDCDTVNADMEIGWDGMGRGRAGLGKVGRAVR